MSKRKKSAYGGLIVWVILFIGCVQSFVDLRWGDAFQLFIPILGIPLWWLVFIAEMHCGVRTDNTPYCQKTAYGLILGCPQYHRWSKVLARFNFFGIGWLRQQAKVTLGNPPASTRLHRTESRFTPTPESSVQAETPRSQLIALYVAIASLAFTIIQTIVAVLALP